MGLFFAGALATAIFPGSAAAHSGHHPPAANPPQEKRNMDRRSLKIDSRFDGLMRHDGGVFDHHSIHGKPTLIFFGFISCSTICPIALDTLGETAKILETQYGKDAVPHMLFITTQPESEGFEAVRERLEDIQSRFIGIAAGSNADILTNSSEVADNIRKMKVIHGDFRAVRDEHHSPYSYLMGADGRFLELLNTTSQTPEVLADQIARRLGLQKISPVGPRL